MNEHRILECQSDPNTQRQPAKVVSYDGDVFLLPKEFKGRGGDVSIPRSTRRN